MVGRPCSGYHIRIINKGRGTRIWIGNTRTLLQPPTATPIIDDVVVNYPVLFTMLWSLFFTRVKSD